jgi:hypothetical protein
MKLLVIDEKIEFNIKGYICNELIINQLIIRVKNFAYEFLSLQLLLWKR